MLEQQVHQPAAAQPGLGALSGAAAFDGRLLPGQQRPVPRRRERHRLGLRRGGARTQPGRLRRFGRWLFAFVRPGRRVQCPRSMREGQHPVLVGLGAQILQSRFGGGVPAGLGRARILAGAADDQPLLGPGQRDVEQPLALLGLQRLARLLGGGQRARAAVLRPGQRRRSRANRRHRRRAAGARGRGVRQDHDRRFQPLGAVDRHHPHLARVAVQLPLQLGVAAFHPVEETGQAGRLGAFVVEREIEQRQHRLLGLAAQLRADPRRGAVANQDAAEHLVGAQEIRPRPQIVEDRPRLGPAAGLKRPRQQAVAPMRQGKDLAFGQPEDRRAQRGGQRQLVRLGHDRRDQRQKVAHRDMRAHLQPVGARDRHPRLAQRLDHRVEHRPAPPHQDQHVARPDRLPAAGQVAVAARQVPQPLRDLPGEQNFGRRRRRRVGGDVPRHRLGLVRLGADERPELDAPGHVALERLVLRGMGVEQPVDQRQDRRRRAERIQQLAILEHLPDILQRRAVAFGLGPEMGRVGALEGIDRLLLVADDEDRAQHVARALPGEELGGQRVDHLPLLGAGVLRLVDQHVVDPAVELVAHPFGRPAARQHQAGAADHVVVIQQPQRLLARLVGGDEAGGEAAQRASGDKRGLGLAALGMFENGLGEPGDKVGRLGQRRNGILGRQPFADLTLCQ